jgi:hypothetical protein
VPVADQAVLETALTSLLADEAERQRLAREARACVERFTGALDRTLAALQPFLERLERRKTKAESGAESGAETRAKSRDEDAERA